MHMSHQKKWRSRHE